MDWESSLVWVGIYSERLVWVYDVVWNAYCNPIASCQLRYCWCTWIYRIWNSKTGPILRGIKFTRRGKTAQRIPTDLNILLRKYNRKVVDLGTNSNKAYIHLKFLRKNSREIRFVYTMQWNKECVIYVVFRVLALWQFVHLWSCW